MSKTYVDTQNKIDDLLRDTSFSSNHSNEVLRAINNALDSINNWDTGDPNQPEGAFDFQKEIADIAFDDDYSEYTLTDGLNYKFPSDLRIDTDEDIKWEYVEPEYYWRKAGVYESTEYMYTVYYEGNCHKIKINYDTTDTLNFEFYSANLVLDDDGSTRKENFPESNNVSDTLLIPDRFFLVLVELAVADLYRIMKGPTDQEHIYYLNSGRVKLKQMINSIGVVRKKPRKQFMIRGNWKRVANNRISTSN